MAKRKKKKSFYQKALISFTCILVILGEALVIYVGYSLKVFEDNNIDNYMDNLVEDISKAVKNNNADKYFAMNDLSNKYESDASLNKGYKEVFKESKISYKPSEIEGYDLYADDQLIATIILDESHKIKKLGLLNFALLKVKDIQTYTESGLFKVEADIPEGYTLYINKTKVDEEAISSKSTIDGYEEVGEMLSIPYINHYLVTGLTSKPKVEVTDSDGKDIKVEYQDGVYSTSTIYKTDSMDDANSKLESPINPLELAEKWSLFLTADLDGEMHGFSTIRDYFVQETAVYNRAIAWATGIDITFTSRHTLDNPIFSNESLSNITVYNSSMFSVDIHLEKVLHVNNGLDTTDVLNETFYFVYFDGMWRVVNMKTITNNDK